MEDLKKYFKEDLIKGYKIKYAYDLKSDELNVFKANNEVFSFAIDQDMIVEHNFTQHTANVFLFNSVDKDEIFTHYFLAVENNKLLMIATVYRYVDDHSIINTIGADLVPKNGNCASIEVFFAENKVLPSPMSMLVKLLCNNNFRVENFLESGDIVIDAENPYYIINKTECSFKNEINRERKR